MNGRLAFREFAAACARDAQRMKRHGEEYLRPHVGRFYETYCVAAAAVAEGASVLSVGAGGAYVEKQLARFHRAKFTVVDFPEAIREHEEDYGDYQFRGVGTDLAAETPLALDEQFDAILSFEVAEHLPISVHQHVQGLSGLLGPGGRFLLSTPNAAHLPNVLRLLRGKAILPDARMTFAPSTYENEHVHRREYVAGEIRAAFAHAGLVHEKTVYLSGRNPSKLSGQFRRLYDLVPRWKKILLAIARR